MVQPPNSLFCCAWVMARCTPFSVPPPMKASPPLVGRSLATVIEPVQLLRPPPPPDDEDELVVPQAVAPSAASRPAADSTLYDVSMGFSRFSGRGRLGTSLRGM